MKQLLVLLFLFVSVKAVTLAQSAHLPRQKLPNERYIHRYGSLTNSLYRIKGEKVARVTFLGGSITNMEGWRNLVCNYLTTTYPETKFDFVNAGIPSLGSFPHAFRLEQDVLSKGRTDLLFVESAVNDHVNGTSKITQRRALEGIIRHMRDANPDVDIVLMAFVDEDKMADYRAGKVPVEIKVHQDMAQRYHLPFLNLAQEVTDRIDAGEFTWKDDFRDLHPSPFGHEVYFNTIRQLLDVELHKPLPRKLETAPLPKAADPLNYQKAQYLDIRQAVRQQEFQWQESWQPVDSVPTRPGFVQVPMLVTEQSGASLELPFSGRTIGIAVVSGPDTGQIEYRIDGKAYPPLDLYTQWSKDLHLPWYVLLADALLVGKHSLQLQISAQSNTASRGHACRIVYFLVNP